MYVPEHFRLQTEACLALLAGGVAGDLITTGPDGLAATMIPMLWEPGGEFGVLTGHLGRVNPQWQHAGEGLFVWHGTHDYIDSAWLSRPEAISVPTWNYLTVHAYGELVVHPEPEWCLASVRRLSAAHADASVDQLTSTEIDGLLKSLVGLELRITRLVGKAKMSQNKPVPVVEQVIAGLEASGGETTAAWMREHSLPRAKAKAELVDGIRTRRVDAD